MKNNLISQIGDWFLNTRWNIGFIEDVSDIPSDTSSVKWLKHNYKDGWFADPFILDYNDDNIEVIVEEFYYPIKRGRISLLVIDRKTSELDEVRPLIELDTHLSFPAILRQGNDIYIYPENGASGKLNLYKLNSDHTKAELCATLADAALADAIIYSSGDGTHLLLCTDKGRQNGDLLSVFEAPNATGPYKYARTIVFPSKCARNGGDVFYHDDKPVKVSQDNDEYYGKGLIFFDITGSEPKEISRLYGTKFQIGVHTYNRYENLAVIDCKKYRLGALAYYTRKFARKIKSWIK